MPFYNEKIETASRKELEDHQLSRLKRMLSSVMKSNEFYKRKYRNAGVNIDSIKSMNDIKILPFTDKEELEADQLMHPLFGTNLTEPLENYVQYHQTTGTTGNPLKLLDTKESWDWRGRCASNILTAAGVTKEDTILFAFNFGPYTAFWIAYEGAYKIGSLIIPTGGWNTEQRLDCILENRVTVVVCTPTYSSRLAAVAQDKGLDLRGAKVHTLILSGEPGVLVPSIRNKIESPWDARAFDFIGLTEVGSWGFQCDQSETSIHILESEFIAEIIDPDSGEDISEGEQGELVLTNLGRICTPAIRYRTRDLVRAVSRQCECGRTFKMLEGGALGRRDQMVKVRGTNIFPSAVGTIVEKYVDPGYEYQIITFKNNDRDDIKILIEKEGDKDFLNKFIQNIQAELKAKFNLTFNIEILEKGKLPRYEYKAKRLLDERTH